MIAILKKATPNYRVGKIPRDVKAAVIHVAEGSEASVDSWFGSPKSEVSAHFLVGFDGEIRQYVSIHDVAWHAGRVLDATWPRLIGKSANAYTVGIEHEGSGRTAWPEAQLTASTLLSAWLAHRFGWNVSAETFPTHASIFAGKPQCPGPHFHVESYVARVRALLALFGDDIPQLITGIR